MLFKIVDNGKILKKSPDITTDDFVVLTGENGAGKTQLLNFIIERSWFVANPEFESHGILYDDDGTQLVNIFYTQPGLVLGEPADANNLLQTVQLQWKSFQPAAQAFSLIDSIEHKTPEEELAALNRSLTTFILSNLNTQSQERLKGTSSVNQITADQIKFIKELARKCGKDLAKLNLIDFMIFYDVPMNLFSPYLDFLFHQFHLKAKYYPHLVEGVKAPLQSFNEILEYAKFKYRAIYKEGYVDTQPPPVILVDRTNNNEIHIQELSSGEKAIMALIFTLYNSSLGGSFPKVILFDEPDALLHPSMVKLFLEVVQNVIVRENKVKVIMTTHSPSTIALAPNESIYVMDRNKGYLVKAEKALAIRSLLSGVSSLFVSYENRRQVFVESPFDVMFYEKIYQKLAPDLNSAIFLSFISSGDSRTDKNGIPVSNCDQVTKITSTLRETKNQFIWGIVDYDGKSVDTDFVKVLGNGQRYSIESYLLDPILVAALLLREKFITNTDIGMEIDYTDFKSIGQNDVKLLANFVVQKISSLIGPQSKTMTKVCLLNCFEIEIPSWYLQYPGHELELLLLRAFPKLNELKKNKEELLKLAVIDKVIDDFPDLLSTDFTTIFNMIQEY